MPLYEFKCKKCNKIFEELKPYNESFSKCPKCNSKSEKLMSSFTGFIKGSSNRSLDSIVGEDAERRWKIVENRNKNKSKKSGVITK